VAQKGTLVRNVTHGECPWLDLTGLPEGTVVYEYSGYTYGCISDNGIAVSNEPDSSPFYEVPADSVSWNAMPNVLELPKDPTRVVQLKQKLEEYRERFAQECKDGRPDFYIWDSICKIAVLRTLLQDESIDLNMVREKLVEEHGEAVSRLRIAFRVIADYCATGGANVFGGTGLK